MDPQGGGGTPPLPGMGYVAEDTYGLAGGGGTPPLPGMGYVVDGTYGLAGWRRQRRLSQN